MRIRESHTPGRKVGLWGCDFCDFTDVNVATVQAHVHERHLAALRRSWDEVAALWQQHQGEAAPYDDGSSSGSGHHADSSSPAGLLHHHHQHHQQQQAMVAGRQFRFAVPVIGQGSGDSSNLVAVQYVDTADDALPLEPIVICKVDEDEEEGGCALPRGGPASL